MLTPLETALPRAPKGLQVTLSFLLGVPAPDPGCCWGELVPLAGFVSEFCRGFPPELLSVGHRCNCFCCFGPADSPESFSYFIAALLLIISIIFSFYIPSRKANILNEGQVER